METNSTHLHGAVVLNGQQMPVRLHDVNRGREERTEIQLGEDLFVHDKSTELGPTSLDSKMFIALHHASADAPNADMLAEVRTNPRELARAKSDPRAFAQEHKLSNPEEFRVGPHDNAIIMVLDMRPRDPQPGETGQMPARYTWSGNGAQLKSVPTAMAQFES